MAVEIEHAERIAVLEEQVRNLKTSIDANTAKVDELLGIVQQARGAKWALLGLGTFAGSAATIATMLVTKWSAVVQVIAGNTK